MKLLDQRQAESTAELGRVWLEFDRAGAADRWINYLATHTGRATAQRGGASRGPDNRLPRPAGEYTQILSSAEPAGGGW